MELFKAIPNAYAIIESANGKLYLANNHAEFTKIREELTKSGNDVIYVFMNPGVK